MPMMHRVVAGLPCVSIRVDEMREPQLSDTSLEIETHQAASEL